MQLHILHINNGGEKLEVFTSEEQCDQRFESFYDKDALEDEEDPRWMQENIHRYMARSLKEYRDVCEHVGCTPDHSLWFIEGFDEIVDYKHIHNFPQLYK